MDVHQENNENYYITNLKFVYKNCHCFEVCKYCTAIPVFYDTLIFKLQYKRGFDNRIQSWACNISFLKSNFLYHI